MASEFHAPQWTLPPSANSLGILNEACGTSTAYAIDPNLPLDRATGGEIDRANDARVDEFGISNAVHGASGA